ncbi:hypothetical protein Tco_1027623, partial [Tanacetum coccineum]
MHSPALSHGGGFILGMVAATAKSATPWFKKIYYPGMLVSNWTIYILKQAVIPCVIALAEHSPRQPKTETRSTLTRGRFHSRPQPKTETRSALTRGRFHSRPQVFRARFHNDDIIDDDDAIPHDLADSDDEDLVNVDDDDGVDVMSTDVAQGHDGDGDDCPLHTIYPPVTGVALLTE